MNVEDHHGEGGEMGQEGSPNLSENNLWGGGGISQQELINETSFCGICFARQLVRAGSPSPTHSYSPPLSSAFQKDLRSNPTFSPLPVAESPLGLCPQKGRHSGAIKTSQNWVSFFNILPHPPKLNRNRFLSEFWFYVTFWESDPQCIKMPPHTLY